MHFSYNFGVNTGGGAGGVRPRWAELLPEFLKPLGYRSYHSGKWHVDGKPLENGFDHSYYDMNRQGYFTQTGANEDDVKLPNDQGGRRFLQHHRRCRLCHQVSERARRQIFQPAVL